MKKIIGQIIGNILLTSLFGFVSLLADENTIKVIVPYPNVIYSKGLLGLQSSFQQKIEILYLSDVMKQGENGSDFFLDYENRKLPFLITFGLESTQLASSYLKETPILYSFVHSSRILFTGQKKMCGFDLKPKVRDYYKVLKELKPNASRVYSFYSSPYGEYAAKETEYWDLYYGIYTRSMQVDPEDFQKSLNAIDEEIDGFLMIADPLYDRKNFEILSEYCKQKNIVLMTVYPALVDMGATFAITQDYTSVGEQTGRFATSVLENKIVCNQGPTMVPDGQILYFNESYASSSGLEISESVKKRVQEDELLSLGLELYYKKMYVSSKSAFQKIIDKNPQHEVAKFYLSQLKYRLTKDETDKYSKMADGFMQKKQYRQAKEYYTKVLRLNPDLKDIRTKHELSVHLESEEKRMEASSLYKKGKPFLAVKKYLESIQVQPSNSGAKSDLDSLRRKEKEKVPDYLKSGLDYYNARNYVQSIETFENILLVEPDNRNAIEYLRLSKVKKEALDKLQKCQKESGAGCELLKK